MQQPTFRLGCAEEAILKELRRRGGHLLRGALVATVHLSSPSRTRAARLQLRRGSMGQVLPHGRAREHAESTLSRSLRSLERKELITRTFSQATRQTIISLRDGFSAPAWVSAACAEEAFADRCDALSVDLRGLARRARERARRLREDRRSLSTARERDRDAALWARLISTASAATGPAPPLSASPDQATAGARDRELDSVV